MTDTTTRPVHPSEGTTRRRAGWATLGAAAALALTPVTVFVVPWAAIDPKFAAGDDPIWRDPVATISVAWLGPIYAAQGVLFAVALISAALALAPRGSRHARLQLGAAFSAAALMLVSSAMNSTMYSASFAGFGDALATIQPDAGTRQMIGFSILIVTQGLTGAAGLAVLVWLLDTTLAAHARAVAVVVALFGIAMLLAFHAGLAAAALLLSMFPLGIFGIWQVATARRVS